MKFLLARFTLRYLGRDWLRTLLSIGGVGLGVAVFLAIRIANVSVLAAFAGTVDAIAGKANLEISAPDPGLDERLFPRIEATPGVEAAAPRIEAVAPIFPGGSNSPVASTSSIHSRPLGVDSPSVFILGVDPFRETPFMADSSIAGSTGGDSGDFLTDPAAAQVSSSLAASRGLRVGGKLPLVSAAHPVDLHIVGVWPPDPLSRAYGGKVALMDIAAAQELFGRPGYLSRVEIKTAPGAVDRVRQALAHFLPHNAVIQRPAHRTASVERMLGAFQLNLEALSLIALFVGMFLIYNSLSAAVVRRRGELGTLRGLGATRVNLFTLVLAEAGIIGAVGSLCGLALGYTLARGLLASIAATVTALYVRVEAATIHAPSGLLAAVWILGFAAALLAAVLPALEAAGAQPAHVMRQGAQVRVGAAQLAASLAAAAVSLLGSLAFSWASARWHLPWFGFAAAFSTLFGFSILAPAVCVGATRTLHPLTRLTRGVGFRIGAAFLRASVERVWIVVGSLSAAISMLVGLSTMIGSFRLTVEQWVGQTVAGDLYVSPAAIAVSGSAAVLPPGVAGRIESLPGVAEVDRYRSVEVPFRGRIITLSARTLAVTGRHTSFQLREGRQAEALAAMQRDPDVLISGALSDLYNLHTGASLTLPTPTGPAAFSVAGVFEDYSSDSGAIIMSGDRFRRLFRDNSVNSLAVYTRPGTSARTLQSHIERAMPQLILNIRTNGDLRREIMRIFDQTFRVTYALEVVAVLVALLGIANTLISLVRERSRQLAMLRAVGASRLQVVGTVMAEASLIGLISWALGVLCGVALAAELVYVVLPQFFHWTVSLAFQPVTLGWTFLLIMPAALAAAVLPALAASRVGISRALRTE